MINSFIKLKWFHPKKSGWITDYIGSDDENPCIITKLPVGDDEVEKFRFLISRRMSEDVYVLLEQIMNNIRKEENSTLPEIKIINLGLNCDNKFVRGTFDIKLKNELE